jgi:hypothetical protein
MYNTEMSLVWYYSSEHESTNAPNKDKSNHKKNGFYDELERVFDQFPK